MRFACLAYAVEAKWEALSDKDRAAAYEACHAYGDELRRGGHLVGGEALQSVRNAVTIRHRDGKVAVTDGPYAETKEQLGGLLILEARDLNHAIQLMSAHPGARNGTLEVRAIADTAYAKGGPEARLHAADDRPARTEGLVPEGQVR
jgi:hypothetical protein